MKIGPIQCFRTDSNINLMQKLAYVRKISKKLKASKKMSGYKCTCQKRGLNAIRM